MHAYALAHTCIPPPHTHPHTHARTHTHACTHANVRTLMYRASVCIPALKVNTLTYTIETLQVKLLQSLGLRSTLITDGSKPVNLFTTAQGLLGAIGSGPSDLEDD